MVLVLVLPLLPLPLCVPCKQSVVVGTVASGAEGCTLMTNWLRMHAWVRWGKGLPRMRIGVPPLLNLPHMAPMVDRHPRCLVSQVCRYQDAPFPSFLHLLMSHGLGARLRIPPFFPGLP